MLSLGSRIKQLREDHNWPQRKLAGELDMDVAVLSRIENENRFPKKRCDEIIATVARVFNVPVEELKAIYLSDEVASLLLAEPDYQRILEVSKNKIDHLRSIELVKEI